MDFPRDVWPGPIMNFSICCDAWKSCSVVCCLRSHTSQDNMLCLGSVCAGDKRAVTRSLTRVVHLCIVVEVRGLAAFRSS